MPEIRIHYFTGTGNTGLCAETVQSEMETAGKRPEMVRVEKDTLPPPDPADLHVFLFPVYGMTLPHRFIRYIRQLPSGKGAMAAIIVNHGMISMRGGLHTGYAGQAAEELARMLRRRGYAVFSIFETGYPENITVFAPPLNGKDRAEVLEAAESESRVFARDILAGKRGDFSLKKKLGFWTFFTGPLEWLFGFYFNLVAHPQFGKLWTANLRCNGCSLCARACPAGAIRMTKGYPRWNWDCSACLRCFNICPRQSIQFSAFRVLMSLVLTVAAIVLTASFFRLLVLPFPFFLKQNAWFTVPYAVVAAHLAYFGLFFLFDLVWSRLERFTLIRRWSAFSWTSLYGRYTAPHFIPAPRKQER